MRCMLLVCLICAWAMWFAMLAAAGFLQGDPLRILCHLPKDNLREFTCGIVGGQLYFVWTRQKELGHLFLLCILFLSQPLMNSKLMIKPQQLRTIDDIGRWINDPRKIAHQYLHSIKAP